MSVPTTCMVLTAAVLLSWGCAQEQRQTDSASHGSKPGLAAWEMASDEAISARVSLRDLDLSRPADVQAARKRLAKVAAKLCRSFADTRGVSSWVTYASCTQGALAPALGQLEDARFHAALSAREKTLGN